MAYVPEWAEVVALMPSLRAGNVKNCDPAFEIMEEVCGKTKWKDLTDAEKAQVWQMLKRSKTTW